MLFGYSLEPPRRGEAILMSTHDICFYGELQKIIFLSSPKTLFICFTVSSGARLSACTVVYLVSSLMFVFLSRLMGRIWNSVMPVLDHCI